MGLAAGLLMMAPAGQPGVALAGTGATPSLSCPTTPYGVSETLVTNYAPAANGQPMDLDEYQPVGDSQSKLPGVILVHGGGWSTGNFIGEAGDSLTTIGDCLAENGFDAFSIDYALTVNGGGSFPENLQDINSAITWAKANVANLDSGKLFILGTSAGANLADLAGENAMGIQDGLLGVISESAPADLTAAGMGCSSTSGCVGNSPGGTIEKYLKCFDDSSGTCNLYYQNGTTQQVSAPVAYADASPTITASQSTAATPPDPPYLLANGSDEAIPLAQATSLAQALQAQCTTTSAATSEELAVLPGDQHALTYSDLLAGPVLDFLNAVLAGTLPADCSIAAPLTGAAMAYDANSSAKTIIRFGGCCTSSGAVSGTTQSLDPATGTWSPVTISGSAPVARVGATLGYDPISQTLVLFGGEYLPGGSSQPVALNDTWELSYRSGTNTGTWTQVDGSGCLSTCAGAPPPRYGAAADQAPRNQGMALFGGENLVPSTQSGAPTATSDTWLWNGTWTQLAPAISPSGATFNPRYGAMLVYDGPHNADLLFGGDDADSSCDASCLNLLNDTWALTYNTTTAAWTWTEQASPPPGLTARDFAASASVGTGAVLFGGMAGTTGTHVNGDQLLADTWTWNGTAWSQACTTCVTVPPPSLGAAMAYHRADAQDFLSGGYTNATPLTTPSVTWTWNGTTWTTP